MIDWGPLPNGLKVFCAVLAWSRVRFVRVARDETAATTLAMLADCFDTIGGVPAKVLADRMGCLKGGTVAERGDPDTGLRPLRDPLPVRPGLLSSGGPGVEGHRREPRRLRQDRSRACPTSDDLTVLNDACRRWCVEVNARVHSETCAVPDDAA